LVAALVCEVVLTFGFLFVILGATDKRAPAMAKSTAAAATAPRT
jgi:glycerol uptake facilitator-like aquaporin